MTYCYEAGVAHSVFLAWDPEDRAKTIAYALEKGERCSSCGTSGWEWQLDPDAYIAVRQQCPGCMRRESMLEAEKEPPKGSTVVMLPKSVALDMLRNPEAHLTDSPAIRRRRRRQVEIDRLARLAAEGGT